MNDRINEILSIQMIVSSFYLGEILLAVSLKISLLWPKFVKLPQTICTCRWLVMTEILSKRTTFFANADRPTSINLYA